MWEARVGAGAPGEVPRAIPSAAGFERDLARKQIRAGMPVKKRRGRPGIEASLMVIPSK